MVMRVLRVIPGNVVFAHKLSRREEEYKVEGHSQRGWRVSRGYGGITIRKKSTDKFLFK